MSVHPNFTVIFLSLMIFSQGLQTFISNWIHPVQKACLIFAQVQPEPLSFDDVPTNLPAAHLASVLRRQENRNFHRILINFEMAAMYLSSLLQVFPSWLFTMLSIESIHTREWHTPVLLKNLRLHSKCEYMTLFWKWHLSSCFSRDVCQLQSLLPNKGNVSNLQLPLHIALSISPAALLIPTLIHKLRIRPHQPLEVAFCLGLEFIFLTIRLGVATAPWRSTSDAPRYRAMFVDAPLSDGDEARWGLQRFAPQGSTGGNRFDSWSKSRGRHPELVPYHP